MASIFTRIIKREIPGYIVAEDQQHIAILDINPLTKGHTLVIPKQEVDYLFDLDSDSYKGLQLFARQVALAVEKVIECERIGVVVLGLEVPHAHVHLIPIQSESDINFSNPRVSMEKEEFEELAGKINQAFSNF